MTDIVAQALADAKTLFNDLMADALPSVVPDVEAFNTEIAGNPSVVEFEAALGQLETTLLAQAPAISQAWVKQVNALISARSTAFLASLSAAPSSGSTSTGA
jgi:hypothetical protein